MISTNRKKQNLKATNGTVLAGNGASERFNNFKIIVTGFNSFGKNLENPSGLTALSLPSELAVGQHKVEIERLLLETCCKRSWAAVHKALKAAISKTKHKSAATARAGGPKQRLVLIMLGLAAVRHTLNLERLALNVRDYPIKDNHGHTYDGEEIASGPLALKTEFPLTALRKRLIKQGFPAVISNHAGTFVCNDVYYQSLNYQLEHGTPDLVLFVHVPPARVFVESVRETSNGNRVLGKRLTKVKQIELMQESIVEVIKFAVNHLDKSI